MPRFAPTEITGEMVSKMMVYGFSRSLPMIKTLGRAMLENPPSTVATKACVVVMNVSTVFEKNMSELL